MKTKKEKKTEKKAGKKKQQTRVLLCRSCTRRGETRPQPSHRLWFHRKRTHTPSHTHIHTAVTLFVHTPLRKGFLFLSCVVSFLCLFLILSFFACSKFVSFGLFFFFFRTAHLPPRYKMPPKKLSAEEARQVKEKLAQQTAFTAPELDTMWEKFSQLAASGTDDGAIDKMEFKQMMGSQAESAAFRDQLFRMFDEDGDGFIDFEEFVRNLALYQNKAKELYKPGEKSEKLFRVYDVDCDNVISATDLQTVLSSCLASAGLELGTEHTRALVEATMQRHGAAGGFSKQQYMKVMGA
eukprot:TRINITY_DN3692_c1_g1_i1.p1 TRINITY_DN3692_c1_g1~~TRINITY_DN3692_c1_g1_i1.p1  ORF type:complete len:295 (+),score=65.68 TRINITY_DN3692_c1_g1_i1:777-1661(+)